LRFEPLEERRLLSTINWTNRGTPLNDSDGFQSVFGTNADLARGVVDAAIDSWERVIVNFNYPGGANTYSLAVNMAATGTGNGASASFSHTNGGKPDVGSITIQRGGDTNGDGMGDGAGYFLDSTPLDSSEFLDVITSPYAGYATTGAAASLGDLFEIVAHELGHALGLSSNATVNALATNTGTIDTLDTPASNPASTYWLFDGPTVDVLYTSYDSTGGPMNGPSNRNGAQHAAPPGAQATVNGVTYFGTDDLMTPYYVVGQRRLVSYNDAYTLGDAFGYTIADPRQFGTFYNMLLADGTLLIRGPDTGNSHDLVNVSLSGTTFFADIDLGVDVPGTGPTGAFSTTFGINQVQRIRIETRDGNDRIQLVGLQNLPVEVDAGTSLSDHDLVELWGDAGANTFTFTQGIINPSLNTKVSGGGNNVEFRDCEEVNVYAQGGNDMFDVAYSLARTLRLYGENGNDTAYLGGVTAGSLFFVNGVAFIGGANVDTLVVNDANGGGTPTFSYGLNGEIGNGFSSYGYVAGNDLVENVIVNGPAGGGIFNADFLFAGVNYTINGGAGSDSVALGSSFQNVLVTAQGLLTINAGGGNDTLTFNDQAGSSIFSVGGGATNFRVGLQGNTVSYNNSLENVVINCGAGNNSIDIDGPNMLTAVTVNAGEGNDTIAIAGSGGSGGSLNLSYIGADVTVNGQGGSDTLFIHNQNGLAQNETLSPTSVGANHTYSYSGIEFLSIDLSQFGETMYVIATNPNTATTIYANGGNDTCYFLTTDLANSYNITFNGQGGIDAAILNDQNATGSHAYQFATGSVSRGTFAFTYDGVNLESLELNASNSADTFSITGLGTPTTINAGLGDDIFMLNTLTGTLTINGGGGLDQVLQNDLPVVDAFNRILISSTQVRHLYRTSLPLNGPYTTQSTVNYTQIDNYGINSEYLTRFEVFSTPAGTNFSINGSAEGATVRLGSTTLVSTGNGSVDNIRGLVQFVGWSGALNSLTIDDGADTTGDTVRVIPNSVSNGPGTPLFAPGGSVNYSNVNSATLVLGSGDDTIYARPSSQNTIAIHGQNPTTTPGDRLNLALAEAQNYVINSTGGGAGNVTSSNLQTLSWTGIEEGPFVDDIAPSIIAQSYDETVIPTILVQFSEDVASGLDVSFLKLINTATNQPVSSGVMAVTYEVDTNTARFTFPGYPGGRLPAGNYSAKIQPGLPDLFGNPLPGPTPTLLFSVGPALPGDYNQDSSVEAADFVLWRKTLGASVPNFSGADGSGNGVVGAEDYGVWATNFGRTAAAAGSHADGSGLEAEGEFPAQAMSELRQVRAAEVRIADFGWRTGAVGESRVASRRAEQAAQAASRWHDAALLAWLTWREAEEELRADDAGVVPYDRSAADASPRTDLQDAALEAVLVAGLLWW